MSQSRQKPPPYEALMLTQIIVEMKSIQICFLDGDTLVGQVRWHTPESIGLRDGKVVNKGAIKFWTVLEES